MEEGREERSETEGNNKEGVQGMRQSAERMKKGQEREGKRKEAEEG